MEFNYASLRDVPQIIDRQTCWFLTASTIGRGQDASSSKGVNPNEFKANDSNIGRDGQEVLYHWEEPFGAHVLHAPNSLVTSNLSKG
jgi:hypothetical protein